MFGYLLNVTWNKTYRIARINILKIDRTKPLPIIYEYKQQGYKGLVFSARLSQVEIIKGE